MYAKVISTGGVRKLEISLTELGRHLRISVSAVGCSVERGEIITCENDYHFYNILIQLKFKVKLRKSNGVS